MYIIFQCILQARKNDVYGLHAYQLIICVKLSRVSCVPNTVDISAHHSRAHWCHDLLLSMEKEFECIFLGFFPVVACFSSAVYVLLTAIQRNIIFQLFSQRQLVPIKTVKVFTKQTRTICDTLDKIHTQIAEKALQSQRNDAVHGNKYCGNILLSRSKRHFSIRLL